MKTIVESKGSESKPLNAFFAGLALALLAIAPARAEYGYSYFRTVEGGASLQSAEGGEWLEAIENHPLIAGDYLQVDSGARIEVVLADGGLLRIAGGTEISFDSLAWTQDTDATVTRLYLSRGEVQVILGDDVESYEPLEIETRDASLHLRAPGAYRVEALERGGVELVVRDGFAEARADQGLTIVRGGEMAYLDRWGTTKLAAAPGFDYLENWGEDLDIEARLAEVPHVEPELRYRAARMASHGNWIDVGGRWGWRPYVTVGWRPYVSGSWVYTPSGITWVAREPWGWIPSHYGSWDLVTGVGWVWFAGGHYSPANVYWYWGPTHVAWVPAGYYTSYYAGHYGHGPRFGVYGWAGGNWGFFSEWVFCPTRYFGRSRYDRYFRTGREVSRHVTYREVPRGIIATDTRAVRRDVWGEPDRIVARLTASDTRLARSRDLPDVTGFVARERDLRPELAEMARPQDLTEAVRRGRPAATETRAFDSGRQASTRPSARDFDSGRGFDLGEGRGTYGRPATGATRPAPRAVPPSEARPETRPVPRPDYEPRDRGTAGSVYTRPDSRTTRPAPRPEPRTDDTSRVYERVYERPEARGVPESRFESRFDPVSPSAVRPPAGAAGDLGTRPPVSGGSADRPVVQKVIEQMRSSRGASPPPTYSRPPAPAPRSAPRAVAPSPRRPPAASGGAVRGSSSSSGRGDSGRSSARGSASSRSGSRKPPSRG